MPGRSRRALQFGGANSLAAALLAALAALPAAFAGAPSVAAADTAPAPADSAPAAAGVADTVLTAAEVAPATVNVAGAQAAPAASAEAVPTALERALLDLVNRDRAATGLPRVEYDAALLPIARARAEAQLPLPSLSHYDADGRLSFVKLLNGSSVDYTLAGENLARLPGADNGTASRAEDALMRSPTHRANILEPTFNRLAVGAALDATGRVVYAQIFRNKDT